MMSAASVIGGKADIEKKFAPASQRRGITTDDGEIRIQPQPRRALLTAWCRIRA
jgi:hypothetical protein